MTDTKVITIYGPMASGKTKNAEAFAKLFGCNSIYEERLGGYPYPNRHNGPINFPALVLTNNPEWKVADEGDSFIHIDLALQLLEDQP